MIMIDNLSVCVLKLLIAFSRTLVVVFIIENTFRQWFSVKIDDI